MNDAEIIANAINRLADLIESDVMPERTSDSIASIAAYVRAMVLPNGLENVVPLTVSLDAIAQQLTIQNQLRMMEMCRAAKANGESEQDQTALIAAITAIERGLSYTDMRGMWKA